MKIARFAVVVTLIVFCASSRPAAQEVSADLDSLACGNREFALDLYAELRETNGNLFFSPHSISTALAMTYAGARGTTALEMARTLHFAMDQSRLHAAFTGLERSMGDILDEGNVELYGANSLWPQEKYSFLEEYLSLTRRHYDASVTPLDFSGAPEEARRTINDWVEARTRDRIKDLIPPGDLDPATLLVLVNAIYFRGDWARQFDMSQTREDRFFRSDGGETLVQMMDQLGEFAYGESGCARVLELPYKGNDLSMFVILPVDGCRLDDVEDALTESNLKSWVSNLTRKTVRVYLPKFQVTWGTMDLVNHLKSLGMRDAFLPKRADFSGMDGTRSLFIDLVLHKAFIEVNEEGSEAAASTAVALKRGVARPLTFRADRPFIFLIRGNASGSILFLGRLVDPGEAAK